MNKLAIGALIIAIISWMDSLIMSLLARSGNLGVFPLPVFYIIPLIGLVLAIVALRQIKRTSEKGKSIAIVAIVLVSLKLLGIVYIIGLAMLMVSAR